jgi:hypothetical protein
LYPYQGLYPDADRFMGQEWDTRLDTVLEVFTGTSFADLVLIGANDDEPGGEKWSALTVAVQAGTTYYIRVNSWDESELLPLVTSGFGAGGFGEREFGA